MWVIRSINIFSSMNANLYQLKIVQCVRFGFVSIHSIENIFSLNINLNPK